MLVGATPDPADLPLLELLEIGSNRAARFAQRPGHVLLAEEEAPGTSVSAQRDVNEQLEGPVGEFLHSGLPAGGGGKPAVVTFDLQTAHGETSFEGDPLAGRFRLR